MRSFKKFIIVAVCIALTVCSVKLLDFLFYPCTYVRNDVHAISTEQNDVLILGTSNGMSDLDPDMILKDTGLTGHNMCAGGEYPVDAYYLAKLAIEEQNPKTIIFELDPGYFTTEKEKGNNYLLFFHEFPASSAKLEYFFATLADCDIRSPWFALHEYALSLEVSRMQDTVYQKWNNNYDVSYLKGSNQEYHENGFIERYAADAGSIDDYDPVLFDSEKVAQTNMDYLEKLIDLCDENNIEFIATTMPLPNETLEKYSTNFEDAWDYFSEFFEEHGVKYYNFNREYAMYYTRELSNYIDYDGHMNGDSAEVFSIVFGNVVFGNNQ